MTAADERGAVTAVVPLRDGVSGKSRLAAAMDPGARRRLVVALARHVLGVLAASPRVARVVVVTADPAFARAVLAQEADAGAVGTVPPVRQYGMPNRWHCAEVIAEPPGRTGLNAALEHAREHVRAGGPGRLLVVHADLPLLTVADVDAVLDARDEARTESGRPGVAPADVVVATDRHGTGTNLLALPTDAAFAFRFGQGSRAAHGTEAAERGLTCAVVHRPGTAADLDTLDDWGELPARARDRLRSVADTPGTPPPE